MQILKQIIRESCQMSEEDSDSNYSDSAMNFKFKRESNLNGPIEEEKSEDSQE